MSAPSIPQSGFMRQWQIIGRRGVTTEEAEKNKGRRAPRGRSPSAWQSARVKPCRASYP